ncbi:peptidoglycan-binding protein LysM [Aquamicrobium zhengzhouense]|uniref:Peptidoglycan-binding protein LysM n=1 Tax=Aquamicrobium zhengzhouense TaxID=2781738 RepID=A0ABS0SFT2_9HYPH|nr:peptidoglycan-binding protein LysM [Aquamicrobium zhengzhouense]MBI1622168.1 peptidoglycan-binding protein LysM [Aquamicrobium zhengzhouense]
MGLFSFAKSIGKKLGFGDDEEEPKVEAIEKELASHNLGTDDVKVEIVGNKAVLKGKVADQATLEKAIVAVGNTLGIAEVETAVEVDDAPDKAEKEPVFYTVKKGDNLWKIAEAHYGKGKGAKHDVIFEANKPMLSHPDKIYPGQVLRIPALD